MRKSIVRAVALTAAAALLTGCQTTSKYSFAPTPQQQVVVRDGRDAIISSKPTSTVMLTPISRKMGAMQRPRLVAVLENRGQQPETFRLAGVEAFDVKTGQQLKVYTVDDLQAEAQAEAVASAIILGAAGVAAGAAMARTAGTSTGYGTVRTPYGASSYTWRTYNPAAAQAAQAAGAAAGGAAAATALASGQRNVQELEGVMLKDQTLMPGEAYGGAIEFALGNADSMNRAYLLRVPVGADVHEIMVTSQGANAS